MVFFSFSINLTLVVFELVDSYPGPLSSLLGCWKVSILSPLLFSIVFSFVWEVVQPSTFPWNDGVFRLDGVWIIAFADDLVVLSPSRIKLAEILAKLDARFPEYNLAINLGKTEVMTFYPRGSRHNTQTTVQIRGHNLKQVDSFSYLGINLTNTSSLSKHIDVVLQRAKVSLHKTTDLLIRLNISDLSRLHCYYLSFIQAQLYGLEIIPHSCTFITRFEGLRNLFVRQMFALPQGTPTELFYILFPSFHPAILCLQRRFSFFNRALKHDLKEVPTGFIFDSSLLARSCGWFYESFEFYKTICQQARITDFDFARDVPALLALAKNEDQFAFSYLRASSGSSLSFFRLIRHPEGLQKFRSVFSVLSLHHQHIVLCFAANQMRWTFLSSPRRFCPLCGSSWTWEHFFSCTGVAPILMPRGLSLMHFRTQIYESNWKAVFRDIAHILLIWSFVLIRDPNLSLNYDVDGLKSMMVS